MSARSERLYSELNTQQDLERLIGKPEDGDFDCKEWSGNSDKSRGSIAKAACGFTNATGGVLIIGMKATGDPPDVVQSLAPFPDRQTVSSVALDIILKHVVPGIAGIEIKDISHNSSAKEGYVIVHIPETEGPPQRSNISKDFYVRVASGTIPMEYFQIADRFGRRPHPRLVAAIASEEERTLHPISGPFRMVKLVIRNDGRGIARFPCLRLRQGSGFNVVQHVPELPPWKVHQQAGWESIRGGSDDVIYPGEIFALATIQQKGFPLQGYRRDYDAADVEVEVFCDGMPPHRQTLHFPAKTYTS